MSDEPSRGHVLFADDDNSVLEPTCEALRRNGFRVTPVNNARQAHQSLNAEAHDALLVDINMPGNEKLQLVRELSENGVSAPIVILTGFPSLETAIDSLRLGVVDYIIKPPRLPELFERVDRAVQRGRLMRGLRGTEERIQQLSTWLQGLREAVHDGVPLDVLRAGQGAQGETPGSRHDPLANLKPDELAQLSRREREVLAALAVGHPAQEIAQLLGLSTNTVRNHLKSIFLKLRVNSQVALLAKLARRRKG